MTDRSSVGRWLATAVAALGAAVALGACGGEGGLEGEREAREAPVVEKGEVGGELNISNWPLYIDVDEDSGERPTLSAFEEESGATVDYNEDINDNNEFFGKVRQQLDRGESGGRDIFVVTDWMAAKMNDLGYLQRLDKEELPTVQENMRDALRSPAFDPERDFSVPWQSGMTGLVVRKDRAPDVSSIDDALTNPDYRGKVVALTEMRDTVPLVMLTMGKDPAEAPKEDWLEAIDKLQEAVDSGQIRRFTGNDYTRDLAKGDAWIAFGWSGDAIQLQEDDENIDFVEPDEGFMLWSDNMVIPVGAPNAPTAQAFMDFVYRPDIAAQIAEYVNFVTPVEGAQEEMRELDPELATSDLIFPSDSFLDGARTVRFLEPEEEREINEAFERVIGN